MIEDHFRFPRPDLDKVDVIFAADVSPFEDMKIKLLNGGHSGLAYVASLAQYEYVHEAIANVSVYNFVKSYMEYDARPSLDSTPGIDLDDYIDTLVERFANVAIADKVERLCGDGISKLSNFLAPVAKDSIVAERSLERIAIIYAAYFHYIKRAVDYCDDAKYGLYEPQVDAQTLKRYSQNPLSLLQRLGIEGENSKLTGLILENIQRIEENGVMPILNEEVLAHV